MKPSWRATHCIIFTLVNGTSKTWMIMAQSTMGGRCAEGATHGEWMSRTPPAWTYTPDSGWTWRGLDTPGGLKGTVTIDELSGIYAAISASAAQLSQG